MLINVSNNYYVHKIAEIPTEQFPRSIFADIPDTRDILARMLRRCRACRECRATSPFSLPSAYLIGRPAVCCGVVLPVWPCVMSFSKVHERDMYDLLQTSRQHPLSILARHVRHRWFPCGMLTKSSRGCHGDAIRMLRGKCSRGISANRNTA